jgi:hypothetical protein
MTLGYTYTSTSRLNGGIYTTRRDTCASLRFIFFYFEITGVFSASVFSSVFAHGFKVEDFRLKC